MEPMDIASDEPETLMVACSLLLMVLYYSQQIIKKDCVSILLAMWVSVVLILPPSSMSMVRSHHLPLVLDDNFVLHMETMVHLSEMMDLIPISFSLHLAAHMADGMNSDQSVSIITQVMSSSIIISTHSIVVMWVSAHLPLLPNSP
jgi:hypothetical protein